jgi:hypothetical protein
MGAKMITKTYLYEAGDVAPLNSKAVNSTAKLCTECGKKLGSNPVYFEVNTSWQLIKPDSDNANSQGYFPVGQTCAFKFDPELLAKWNA